MRRTLITFFFVINENDEAEFRWQDNYVLEWVIEDVVRHLLRKKYSKKKTFDYSWNSKQLDKSLLKRKVRSIDSEVHKRNNKKEEQFLKKIQTNTNASDSNLMNLNDIHNTPSINPENFPPRLTDSNVSKSGRKLQPRRSFSSLSPSKRTLNDISNSVERRMENIGNQSSSQKHDREKRNRKMVNYKRVNGKGFDASFVL